MNEAGFVHWVETLWNCCPHVYHTPLYPAINMKMTWKWSIDTSTMISNHQTRLKQQHPPLPHVSTNKNTMSFSSCIQGSFNLNCYPLGYQKTNEMNHDNQQVKTTYERHLDFFLLHFCVTVFASPPLPWTFTVTTRRFYTTPLSRLTIATGLGEMIPQEHPHRWAVERWVNPESWVEIL